MKRASAYLRKGQIVLWPISQTTEGWLIGSEPIVVTGEDDKEVGAKALWSLSRSTENIPHPIDLWNGPDEMLRIAEARPFDVERKALFTLENEAGCQLREDEVADTLRAAFDACEW